MKFLEPSFEFEEKNLSLIQIAYIIPTDPAVKPTARKKTNSSKSLGNEFTNKLK